MCGAGGRRGQRRCGTGRGEWAEGEEWRRRMGRGERAAEEDGEWRAEEEDEERGGERVWQWRTRRGERVVEDWEGRVEWVVVGDRMVGLHVTHECLTSDGGEPFDHGLKLT